MLGGAFWHDGFSGGMLYILGATRCIGEKVIGQPNVHSCFYATYGPNPDQRLVGEEQRISSRGTPRISNPRIEA